MKYTKALVCMMILALVFSVTAACTALENLE